MRTELTDMPYRRLDTLVLPAARVLLSVPFICGGVKNLLAYSGFVGYLAAQGMPMPGILAAPSIATDLLGGLLLVLGIRLRLVAPYLALYTIFTAFVGHPFWLLDDPGSRGEMTFQFWKNLSIAGGLLGIFVTGAVEHKR
ncbi:UNVERIFIED_ORG: putative oxidoreductase [Burkholderia sp. 1595]|uniref:Oxidoreductase n=2 Tax=Paraburkholderia terricola TaxID=169427 RepID=A0ABU1M2N4_9BURK|nr:putative oxidoreductase [Paraburkholderia terricola]